MLNGKSHGLKKRKVKCKHERNKGKHKLGHFRNSNEMQ